MQRQNPNFASSTHQKFDQSESFTHIFPTYIFIISENGLKKHPYDNITQIRINIKGKTIKIHIFLTLFFILPGTNNPLSSAP